MEHVLEVRGLVHRYGDLVALDGMDLTVESGECVALLGPNGAGKTTLVRNVIGLIEGRADVIEVVRIGRYRRCHDSSCRTGRH